MATEQKESKAITIIPFGSNQDIYRKGGAIMIHGSFFGRLLRGLDYTTLSWPSQLDNSRLDEAVAAWYSLVEPEHIGWSRPLMNHCRVEIKKEDDSKRSMSLRTPATFATYQELIKDTGIDYIHYVLYARNGQSVFTHNRKGTSQRPQPRIETSIPRPKEYDASKIKWAIDHHLTRELHRTDPANIAEIIRNFIQK